MLNVTPSIMVELIKSFEAEETLMLQANICIFLLQLSAQTYMFVFIAGIVAQPWQAPTNQRPAPRLCRRAPSNQREARSDLGGGGLSHGMGARPTRDLLSRAPSCSEAGPSDPL